jgi:hypothetical protein
MRPGCIEKAFPGRGMPEVVLYDLYFFGSLFFDDGRAFVKYFNPRNYYLGWRMPGMPYL